MVAPTAFTYNEQTAQDNHFMHTGPTDASTSIMQVNPRCQRYRRFMSLMSLVAIRSFTTLS